MAIGYSTSQIYTMLGSFGLAGVLDSGEAVEIGVLDIDSEEDSREELIDD